MKKISFLILIISAVFSSCENGDWEFPDYDYSAVYFAYQTPVRAITLGTDDLNDNSLDNDWQCQILATVGGFREVKKDIEISFKVDNSLCDALENVIAMPSNYYSLSDNSKMIIKKGSKMAGGVVVQLNQAFFDDPLALSVNYVIPVVITGVANADSVLAGTPADGVGNPNRLNPDDWAVAPKDYMLYAVKYLNPWDVTYLRRGTDNITENGVQRTEKRQGTYSPENDEEIRLNSISLNETEFPVNNQRLENVNLNMTFKLDFDPATQKCTFANGAWKEGQLVNEYEFEYTQGKYCRVFDINVVSGTGEYREKGEKNSWNNKDRDALYLNYTVEYKVELPKNSPPQTIKYETEDVLVFMKRNVSVETFVPVLK